MTGHDNASRKEPQVSETEYHWAAGPNDAGTWVIYGRRADGALNSAVILVYPLTDDDGHDLAPGLVERIFRALTGGN